MKKDGKQRLFEVMGRLDKTFKPNLNEGIEQPEKLSFIEGWGYQDKNGFKRFNGTETGQLIRGKVKRLPEINVKLDDGREIVTSATAVKDRDSDEILDAADAIGRTLLNPFSINEGNPSKKNFIINLWGEDEEVHFDFDIYANNNALAVELVTTDGEPYAMVSVNLPESAKLPPDEFFLKDWSENEPVADALIKQKIILPTGKQASSGFVTARSYKISPEYI